MTAAFPNSSRGAVMAFSTSLTTAPRLFVGNRATKSRLADRVCRASDRQMWLANASAPAHLDGSLAGDFGFDPLGLGSEPDRLAWYVEAEKVNGRWAMNGVAGILATELLGVEKEWYLVGERDFILPFNALVAFEAVIMGYLEMKRYRGWVETGESGAIDTFPWDPLKMASPQMALKEVKNGRLAMIAFVGFVAQAVVVRKGPIGCLSDHLAAPFENNLFTNLLKLPELIGTYPAAPAVQQVTEAVADVVQ